MKKLRLAIIGIIGIVIISVMYQQHQTILNYRQNVYYHLQVLAVPIEKVLDFHQTTENYEDEERKAMLDELETMYTTIFNYTGGEVITEQKMRDTYYDEYTQTKIDFVSYLQKYINATTPEQREQAYMQLKGEYDEYKIFLQLAKDELQLPDPTYEERR